MIVALKLPCQLGRSAGEKKAELFRIGERARLCFFHFFFFFFLKKILCIFSAFEHSNYELKNASVLINEVFF